VKRQRLEERRAALTLEVQQAESSRLGHERLLLVVRRLRRRLARVALLERAAVGHDAVHDGARGHGARALQLLEDAQLLRHGVRVAAALLERVGLCAAPRRRLTV
jgi:hypothetical protein